MTNDEYREKCIEAMRAAYRTELNADGRWEEMRGGLRAMTAAFDALPTAGASVVPTEATEEMRYTLDYFAIGPIAYAEVLKAGDLTNPPEEKP